MKKLILLLLIGSLAFAQIEDDMGDEKEAVDLSTIDCTLEANNELFAELKADEANLKFQVNFWYSEGFQYYKKWKSEKDAEKLKSYGSEMEKNFWKLVVNDPKGTVQTTLKSRGSVGRTLLAMEKLADMYINDNNTDMLKEIVARGLEHFPDERKIQQYASTYYKATNNDACAVGHFEKWNDLLGDDEKDNKIKLLEVIINIYKSLNNNELVRSSGERLLALDDSRDDVKAIIRSTYGDDPEKYYSSLVSQLSGDPENIKLLKDAAVFAKSLDKLQDSDKYFKILLSKDPSNEFYLENLTSIHFELQNYNNVIKYGKNLSSTKYLQYVIQAYIGLGQFSNGYNIASKVQNSNSSDGHYLKGYVYEKTAQAAQQDNEFAKKAFEWRLLYRLAYIEYQLGGADGKDRAKSILPLIPNKGDIFLKNKRIKPSTGKYSSWINWNSSYDNEVYSAAN